MVRIAGPYDFPWETPDHAYIIFVDKTMISCDKSANNGQLMTPRTVGRFEIAIRNADDTHKKLR